MEAVGDVGVGHGWVEEGVVDHFGEEGEGDADAGGGCRGCHCCLFEWLRSLEREMDGRVEGGKNGGEAKQWYGEVGDFLYISAVGVLARSRTLYVGQLCQDVVLLGFTTRRWK